MQLKSVKGYSPGGQLLMLLLFFFVGFILAAAVQLIIAFKMMPGGVSLLNLEAEMMKAMKDPKNVNLVRLTQVAGTFCLLFVPAVLYNLVTNGKNKFWLGFNNHLNGYQVLIGFVIIFAANIAAGPIADLTKDVVINFPDLDRVAKQLEATYNEQVMIISNLRSWPEYLMAIIVMAFFPALFEEMFFRGALQNVLVRWIGAPIIAIIITSLLFSIIHMSIYLFLSRAILGFVLGLMYHQSKNIWVNVIAHFLNNAIAVSQLFWMSRQKNKIDISKLDPKIDWWYGVMAVVVLYFLFRLLEKYSIKNKNRIQEQEVLLYNRENKNDPSLTLQ